MDGSCQQAPARPTIDVRPGCDWMTPRICDVLRRKAVAGDEMVEPRPGKPDGHPVGLAKTRRRLDQRIEHRLQIEGRAADDLEHVGGGGLLLQRFAQLVEQARVLDRDHRLGGEVRDQLDLLVGERSYLLAVDGDGADQLIFLEHRNEKYGPIAGEIDKSNGPRS